MFTYSERRVTVCHYNDKRSRPGSTMTRWSFDNGQRHVTAFRPISEAARSWSYDNVFWRFAATWRLVCIHLMSRPNSGCGRGSTITRIVVCFVVVAVVVTLCNDGLPSAKFPSSGGMHVTIDWLQRNYSGTVIGQLVLSHFVCCEQTFLSYDQLWAASLICRNAVTWRWTLSYVHRFMVTRGDIIMPPGWRHATFTKCKRKIFYSTLFLFTFCLFFFVFWRLTVSFY